MNMPFQVKVPVLLAAELKGRLDAIFGLHEKELAALDRRMRTNTNLSKVLEEQQRLNAQGRRITIQHVLRVALLHGGIAGVRKLTDPQLLAAVNDDKIVVGRPSAEARRGSRAA